MIIRCTSRGLVLLSVFALGACGGDGSTDPPEPVFSTLQLSPSALTVPVGETEQVTATARDNRGGSMSTSGISFSSSDAGKASVNNAGVVSGVAEGTATITAELTIGGIRKEATAGVTVSAGGFPNAAAVTATTGNTFDPSSVDIARDGSVTWTFESVTHNVTFAAVQGAPSNTGDQTSTTASRTFVTAGTFDYRCTIHGGMDGTVRVH
ncbi:MAG: cupredoxin domain-containing protein [Gemmatimonadaceae bacterium]